MLSCPWLAPGLPPAQCLASSQMQGMRRVQSPECTKPLTPLGWVDSFTHIHSPVSVNVCWEPRQMLEHKDQQDPSLPSRTSQPHGSRVWSHSALGPQPPMGQSSVRTDSDPDWQQVRERALVPGPTPATEHPELSSLLPVELGVESGIWIPHPGFATGSVCAKSLQSCLTLRDPIDSSPPGSPIPGILRPEHWSGLPFPSPVHESEK